MTEEKQKEFWDWIGTNIQKIERMEAEETDLQKVLARYKEVFKFSQIRKSTKFRNVWSFSGDLRPDENVWWTRNGPPLNIFTLNVWKQKGTIRVGISLPEGKTWNGGANEFLDEALRKFETKKNSNKFGL